MSQKSLPKSPKSPRSKSPSCVEEPGEAGEENVPTAITPEELQQELEQELGPAERISEAQQSVIRSRGASGSYTAARTHSRGSHSQTGSPRPPTAVQSRIPSPRGASTCEDEAPRLPSPPVSPVTYGSRGPSPGASQRASRGPSPEYGSTRSKPPSYLQMMQDAGEAPIENYMREASHPSFRGSPTANRSRISGVTFGNKQSGMAYGAPEDARVQSSMSHRQSQNASCMRQGSGNPDAGMSCQALASGYGGASVPGIGTSCGGLGPAGVDMGTSSMGVGGFGVDMATSGIRFGPSTVDMATSGIRFGPSTVDMATSGIRFGPSAVDMATSRMGFDASTVDMATSGMGFGVDAGVSAMSYNASRGRSVQSAGGSCVPGCRKFYNRENQEAPGAVPSGMSREAAYYKQSSLGAHAMGSRTSPSPDRQMGGPEPGMHAHHGGAHHPGPNFDRGASPSRYDPYMKPSPAGHDQHSHHHHHHHHSEGPEEFPPKRDEKVMAAIGHLSQLKKTPSYYRCGLTQGVDFLKVCCPKTNESLKTGRVSKFPEIPCLRQDEIDDLIKCETQDVDSAWFLMSEDKKTYKKPCPKQQKAQMTVKALVQAHANQVCSSQKEYTPLEHPDPEDISPEVAAAMMFSQERGIKMEECPNYTITSLFPDEPKSPFPEKIPQSSISIVDRNSKDQEELMEKSATVPSEGVSDSAYTRTMKEKGEDMGPQRSFDVDFAIGQSKREYVLVAQKPQRVNKVQYRGGTSPSWFPGYFSAFPDDDGLRVVSSPSGVFHKAWVHSNPVNMPTSDVIVLD